jgi:hypothetical protein
MSGMVHRFFRKKSRAFNDLLVIFLLAILVFGVSARFDIFTMLIAWVARHDTWQLDEVFTVALFLVAAFAIYARRRHLELREQIRRRQQVEAEKALLLPELESALADVSNLKRLLPICSHCKKIRDAKGYWIDVDDYLEFHYQTRLDGGLCPECAKKMYGGG